MRVELLGPIFTIGKVIIETNFGPDLALLPPRASLVTMPKPDKLCGNPP